ncbi:unnamed protein product [Dovyalis caffra]|uniref:CST complex subunit CTC1 n=1 Tax=Dovyalis caffra TaxID=77055 RepID=A0AAV1S821_9ROSI|nr:unnamed protein product [Dovyalis caffra]
MEETAVVLTIKELVLRFQPLTATSSLKSKTKSTNQKPQFQTPPPPSTSTSTNPNPNSKPKILTPLNHSATLLGTLTLPTETLSCPNRNCFRFSDDSSTICCDILDFNVNIIGKRIRVLAWNFVPLKHFCGGGFLEIIKWSFVDSTSSVLFRSSSSLDSFPLVSGSPSNKEDQLKARYSVMGPIESISPVFIVPCSIGDSKSQNLRGFIVRIMVCQCKLCNSTESIMFLHRLGQGNDPHSFIEPFFVYFCGASWCWHPVITKLVGNAIMLSGLKKKLVFIGKEESQLMFVTTEYSILHLPRVLKKWLPFSRNVIGGNGECGVYTGVVKGVYMQGMVVELDKEVWLLLTDQLVTAPHSLREGAIILAMNVHFVNPKFSWTKILILGACFKSSITVASFSPLETGCHIVSQSQSQLGKFIDSLTFSARLWTLLVVSCFRKKFAGILSEKEILGSKHFGVLTEFCRHDSCGCGSKPYRGNLKLVAPISIFLGHCENMWMRTALKNCHTSHDKYHFNFLSHERRFNCRPLRMIFSSEDIGILLLGNLEISPSSGRLQLVDATGSMDVLIPDLPSTWKTSSIYEVVKYSVIMEGPPKVMDCLGLLNRTSKWKISLNLDLTQISCATAGDPVIPNRDTVFVEAIVLPWDLSIAGIDPIAHSGEISRNWLNETLGHYIGKNYQEHLPNKRCKIDCTSSQDFVLDLVDDHSYVGSELSTCSGSLRESTEWKCRELSSTHEIPCLAIVRNAKGHNLVSSGKLCCTKCKVKIGADHKPIGRKILVEFSADILSKYQDCNSIGSGKIDISSEMHLWSLSFSSDDIVTNDKSLDDAPRNDSSFSNEEVLMRDQVELLLKRSTGNSPECFSDVLLHLSADMMHLLALELSKMKEGFMPVVMSGDAFNGSPHILTKISASNMPFASSCSSCLSPEGNLVSVLGNVVTFHRLDSNLANAHSSCDTVSDIPHMGCFQRIPSSYCIHVLVGKQMVRIFGSLRKHAYAVGFGAGVNATFHRVLKLSYWSEKSVECGMKQCRVPEISIFTIYGQEVQLGSNRLMLTPVSFIVINSISVANEVYHENSSDFWFDLYKSSAASLDKLSSVMISEFIKCTEGKPVKFNCRVVAVHVLILENRKYDLLSKVQSRQHFVDIPLAAFVLDDGSSSCYCWANAERAATLLRLHEELPMRAFESSGCTLKWVGTDKSSWKTTMGHLARILKKHKRIIVKNHGSMVDSSYQDLTVSVSSDDDISSSDENLVKFIIFHACFGTFWTVTASAMELNAVNQFEKEHLMQMEMTLQSMQNVWAMEVCYTDTLTEAWKMVQEQLTVRSSYH